LVLSASNGRSVSRRSGARLLEQHAGGQPGDARAGDDDVAASLAAPGRPSRWVPSRSIEALNERILSGLLATSMH
jgi:hypothetical protein